MCVQLSSLMETDTLLFLSMLRKLNFSFKQLCTEFIIKETTLTPEKKLVTTRLFSFDDRK